MHKAVRQWVARHATTERVEVIECGARNVNGTVRDLFPNACYTGVDIADGPGVDVVSDWLAYQHPAVADIVLHCEVAEHCEQWAEHLTHGARMLAPGGLLIFTAAGPGRDPHSAIDENPIRPHEWYRNIDPADLASVLSLHFDDHVIDIADADVRAWARKGE